ncbi:hypothetical protein ACQR18_27855 [Bradyrhizobium oligotrophicum]|uniref:hypothetical protein n=1 Tax=Bradyrhizobium oligotrophicum TaxID=44255 RepID=UPI003EBCA51E
MAFVMGCHPRCSDCATPRRPVARRPLAGRSSLCFSATEPRSSVAAVGWVWQSALPAGTGTTIAVPAFIGHSVESEPMPPKRRSAVVNPAILIELACHTLMGIAMGLGFAFGLTQLDAFGISTLIAHSVDPHVTFVIFVGVLTLSFAVGATMTGFVFTMMEER